MIREAAGHSGPFAPLGWLKSHIVAVYVVSGALLSIALLVAAYSLFTDRVRKDFLASAYELNGGHVTVRPANGPFAGFDETAARLKAVPGVKRVRAVIESPAMVSSPGIALVRVRGLREKDLKALKTNPDNVSYGTLDGFDESGGIAIGIRLANSLNVFVGSEITVLAPRGPQTVFGTVPRLRRFAVKAILETGLADYDSTGVFLPLKEAQSFLNMPGAVNALEVVLDNPNDAGDMRPSLQAAAGDGMQLDDWLRRLRAADEQTRRLVKNAAIIEGLNGHVFARPLARQFTDFDETAARLKAVPGVRLALPVVEGQAMASSQKASANLYVRGLRGDDFKALTVIADNIRSGTLGGFSELGGIAIGTGLSNTLNIPVGSEITLITPPGASTAFGMKPQEKRFTVKAVFETGIPDYDSTFVFIPLSDAQSFFGLPDAVHALQLFVDNAENIDAMRPGLQAAAGDDMLLSDRRWRKTAAAEVKMRSKE